MSVMTQAACCLAFFGFLCISEFTIPSDDLFDQGCHLCLSDIAIDNWDNPKMLQVKMKQSKTDPFRKGVNIYLGVTERDLCPIRGILPYLALRGNCSGPLFILSDGRSLTRHLFKAGLDNLLCALNMDKGKYNTHSFRIGWPPQLSKLTFLTLIYKCWGIGEVTPTSIISKPLHRNWPSYPNTSQMAIHSPA